MRSGKVFVFLLLAAALAGALLGPAGERLDPDVGPQAAFFKYALAGVKAQKVYLAVDGKDPSPALMLRFNGVEKVSQRQGEGTVVNLERLEWLSEEEARCAGTVDTRPLEATFRVTPSGKWESR